MHGSSRRTAEPEPRPPGRPQAATLRQSLFSPASQAERDRVKLRLLWAVPLAIGILVLIALLGPSAEEVERKFVPYGTEGPLRLLPEIAIDDGLDAVERQARREVSRPPAAPHYEVIPEETDPLARETVPPRREVETPSGPIGVDVVDPGESDLADLSDLTDLGSGEAEADLLLPSQRADSDFIIRKLVRPAYPARASVEDRQQPMIVVEGAFFLDETAQIVAVMIQSNEGGPEFAEVVRTAMTQWEFEPRLRDGQPPAPRWLVVTWRFRRP